MKGHYRSLLAVSPIILRNNEKKRQILLHVRKNTGCMDGKWDVAGSGHVDEVSQIHVHLNLRHHLGSNERTVL